MYGHNDGMTDMEREMRIAVNEAAIHRLTHKRTNAECIRRMTDEELAIFLSNIAYGKEALWSEPFTRMVCDSCPTVHGTYESGIENDFHECDFVDGKCPHGGAIAWWLQQPAEEDDYDERKENENV